MNYIVVLGLKKRNVGHPTVKGVNFTSENTIKLSEKIKTKGSWKQVEDVDTMWEAMVECL